MDIDNVNLLSKIYDISKDDLLKERGLEGSGIKEVKESFEENK